MFSEELNSSQKAILTSLEERVEDVVEVEKDITMKDNFQIGKDFPLDRLHHHRRDQG